MRFGTRISKTDIENMKLNGSRLFAWGWIEYNDIFPKHPRRRSEVCFEVFVHDNLSDMYTIKCGAFNGADETCHHQPKT